MTEFLGINKPSQALTAMADGLLNDSRRKTYKINFATFGKDDGEICFGCAATSTLQRLARKPIPPLSIRLGEWRAEFLGVDAEKLRKFEQAIDSVRWGDIEDLLIFFRVKTKWKGSLVYDFFLENYNWREQLPAVRKLIRELQEAGL